MVKRFSKYVVEIMFIVWLCCLFFPLVAKADSTQAAAGFTVESVIPSNQVDTSRSYFYLKVVPNVSQTIQVKIRSTQEAAVTVKLGVHDAVSSSNGSIDYTQVKPRLDESLKNPLTELVIVSKNQKEITVANFEEKVVEYKIHPPKAAFSGIKLGALRFVKKETDDEASKGALAAEYAYVIAVMLTEDESAFNRGAELKLKDVGAKISKGKNVIAATIQNDQPKLLQEATIKGSIRQKNDAQVLDNYEIKDFSFAPNSNVDFEVPIERKYPAGKYIFSGEVNVQGQSWRWEKEFKIDTEKKRGKEKSNVERVSWVFYFVVPILGVLFYFVKRQRVWQK